MTIEIDNKSITINSKKYVPIEDWPGFGGEVLTIKEVRPIYGEGFEWLQLGFDMPEMKFSPGDRIRIVKL